MVGPENVTTVVVDEGDREWLLRAVERRVALREGTLRAQPDRSNRSLTRGEVELLRRFNQIRTQRGWADRVHFRYVRLSAYPALRRLPADPRGGKIAVPADVQPMLEDATERDLGSLTAVVARVDEYGPFALDNDTTPATTSPVSTARTGARTGVALPRRTELHLIVPPGPEGGRLRGRIAESADVFAAVKRRMRVVESLEECAVVPRTSSSRPYLRVRWSRGTAVT